MRAHRVTRKECDALLAVLAEEPDGTLPWDRLTGPAIYTANRLAHLGHADIIRASDTVVLRITAAGRKHLVEEITP